MEEGQSEDQLERVRGILTNWGANRMVTKEEKRKDAHDGEQAFEIGMKVISHT